MLNEAEIIKKAQMGDEKAVNKLMNLYKPLVTIIARKYFLINATTDDLIQEGMLGLFKAYRNYDLSTNKASFKTFASICIKRQIQSALIANNRNKNKPINTYFSINNQGKILLSINNEKDKDEEENGFYIASNSLTPEESILFKEKLSEIDLHVNKLLSVFEKKVLQLYIKGLNYVEIAQRLKKEPKSIDNALRRIKIKLKVIRI